MALVVSENLKKRIPWFIMGQHDHQFIAWPFSKGHLCVKRSREDPLDQNP